jgi:hypothetical protein
VVGIADGPPAFGAAVDEPPTRGIADDPPAPGIANGDKPPILGAIANGETPATPPALFDAAVVVDGCGDVADASALGDAAESAIEPGAVCRPAIVDIPSVTGAVPTADAASDESSERGTLADDESNARERPGVPPDERLSDERLTDERLSDERLSDERLSDDRADVPSPDERPPDTEPTDGSADEPPSADTSAGIASIVGSLGPPDTAGALGVIDIPGEPGAAAPAVGALPGAGDGTTDAPVIISAAIRAIATIICDGSSGRVGWPIGRAALGASPGDAGAVDPTADAACTGDIGTGAIDAPPNSSPAIREIAIASAV